MMKLLKKIRPYYVSMISSPAVNANHARKRENNGESIIESTMIKRATRIISIAAKEEADVLILGAWGCGVFGNNPNKVAKYFKNILQSEKFNGCFRHIHFAILNSTGDSNITPFLKAFNIEDN